MRITCVIIVRIAQDLTLALASISWSEPSPKLLGPPLPLINYVFLRPIVQSQEAQSVVDILVFSIRNWTFFQMQETASL